MQITHCEVIPIELNLRQPASITPQVLADRITVVFVRLETRQGTSAWGCAVAQPELTGEQPEALLQACQRCATLVPDLHPTNLEYSLAQLSRVTGDSCAALCAFDLAFHDLLGLASGLPLFRLLGGYRTSIPTSVTIPLCDVDESVERAQLLAARGFRMFKVKGGLDPQADVYRVQAIRRALPDMLLRLDADGGYDVQGALDVARALADDLEMLEQPTPASDLAALKQVTRQSPVPVLADQSVRDPASALELAAGRISSGLCIKLAACGGLRCAAQVDAIARAARMATMVSCTIEPALLISAGLSFALSSPNVRYADLDGHFDLLSDPSTPAFQLEDGCLVASEVPGLGCWVNLD